MITTKRQIRRDSDRFGGYYGAEPDGIPRISDYDNISNLEPIVAPERMGNSMIVSDNDVAERRDELYTATEPTRAAVTAPAIPERPVKPAQPRNKEDLLPTVKTRAYASEKPVREIEEQIEKAPARPTRAALDRKTKIMLFVYVLVALALAIAVIATGVSISSAAAQADAVAAQVAQKQAVIVKQEQELALARDADAIRGKALQNGMVPAGDPAYTVSPVDNVDYPQATPRTDGWDEFFDWVSKVVN